MGEAADLTRGLWPPEKTIGSHPSVTVALPQIQAILDRHNVKVTYFVESWNLSVYPTVIADGIAASGHEIGWHAYRHEAWNKLPDAKAEEDNFKRSFAAMDAFTSPGGLGHGKSRSNAAIVSTGEGMEPLVVLPFQWTTVDAYYYMESFSGLRKIKGKLPEGPQLEAVLIREMIYEIDEAVERGGYLSVLFHPFLTTSPERIRALETVIHYISKKREEGKVWVGRCCDVQERIKEAPDLADTVPDYDRTVWR
ncbi:hypothetical protein LTS10_012921 [Elasticomyces elasticus]|nr:hypothetical protein LTS10_012921 [Elasticomyces elasticus]